MMPRPVRSGRVSRGSRCRARPPASRERPKIEQTINRLKLFRRVATRHDKLASSYLLMVTIAMIPKRL